MDLNYLGGRFNGGNEKSLYQPGHKKPKHKSPKKKEPVDHEEVNILMDTSIQRVMKKNRDLQKKLNDALEENRTLKAQNKKMRSKLNLD